MTTPPIDASNAIVRIVAEILLRKYPASTKLPADAAEIIAAVLDNLHEPTPEMLRACGRAMKAYVDGMDAEQRAMLFPGGRRGIILSAKIKARIRWQAMLTAARQEILGHE